MTDRKTTAADAIYALLAGLPSGIGMPIEELIDRTGLSSSSIRFLLSRIRHHPERYPTPYVVTPSLTGDPIYSLVETPGDARHYVTFRGKHERRRLAGTRIFLQQVQGMQVTPWTQRKARMLEHLVGLAEKHMTEFIEKAA